jgi:HAD superfamily hydrolase (TIGR01509 family)
MRAQRTPHSASVDALVASAWLALDAEQRALSRAGGLLGTADVARRSERVAAERRRFADTLGGIARARHERSSLLGWFAAGTLSRGMLGLPDGADACVFDLDGVLTASARVHAEAWAEALDPLLLDHSGHEPRGFVPFDARGEYEEFLAGRPRLPAARAFLASRGIVLPEGSPNDDPAAATLHGLSNHKQAALNRRMRAGGERTFSGSLGYLEAVRVLGLRRAVVSASANADEMLRLAGIDDLIDVRIDATTLERESLAPLPAPDTLLAACRALGVCPGQAVAFETTAIGIEAAHRAGMELVTDLAQLVRG